MAPTPDAKIRSQAPLTAALAGEMGAAQARLLTACDPESVALALPALARRIAKRSTHVAKQSTRVAAQSTRVGGQSTRFAAQSTRIGEWQARGEKSVRIASTRASRRRRRILQRANPQTHDLARALLPV